MATQFTVNGEVVGWRFHGGNARGAMCEMEMTEAEWNSADQTERVVDETDWDCGSRAEWMAEQRRTATVVWMNRFRMAARARDMQEMAARWSSHASVAHACAVSAQRMRDWRED